MAFEDVVVRVRSKIGISRLSFTKDATLGDLRNELKNRINFSDGTVVKLYVEGSNAEVHGPDGLLLRDLGIKHGTSLFLDQASSDLAFSRIPSMPKLPEANDDIDIDPGHDSAGQGSNRSSAASSSNSNYEDSDKREGEGPLFKSFDAFLHETSFAVGDLPLKNSFLPVTIKRGSVNKVLGIHPQLPMGVTISLQKYRHVDHLEMMNVEEVRSFANYWMQDLEMSFQRAGWMYGYYTEDAHYAYGVRAVCEAIYEPPQVSQVRPRNAQINDVALLDDEMLKPVDKIAHRLGLERIGLIFTRLPNECFLTAKELMRSVEIQYNSLRHVHYTGYPVSTMVTCTMSPDEHGQPVLNAFMASDLAVALYRDEMFHSSQDHDNMVRFRESRDNKEIMPVIIESGKEVTSLDTSWLMVRINESAPIKPCPFFNSDHTHKFPVENRTYSSAPRGALANGDASSRVTSKQFRKLDKKMIADYFGARGPSAWNDFHLLIYVARALDVDTALAVCDSLVNNQPVDELVKDLLM